MTKNVIVTDADGNHTGFTYPKRARGLIKNGRAEYISDCEIRLQNTHASSVYNNITEDIAMSFEINFNARDYRLDNTCSSNVGTRMFITMPDDSCSEAFELGDWNWSWTQIKNELLLEKNTDYVLRFATLGGVNDTGDGTSNVCIFFDDNWDDRYTYPLARSTYKPKLSKKYGSELLRVFEIKFNTGNAEKTSVLFAQQHMVIKIMPVLSESAYAGLEDMTYDEWWADKQNHASSLFDDNKVNLAGAVINNSDMLDKLIGSLDGRIDLSGAIIGQP